MAYRVLIIGCGAIAGGYDSDRPADAWPLSHAGAIARSERFELAACVDPDDDARAAFAQRWRVERHAASLDRLDAEPGEFDLIVIASPTDHHDEQLEWALGMKPRAVFCEKPLAKDFGRVPQLVSAYEAAKIPLAVNYTRRWAPDLNGLIDDIRNDEWGDLLSAVGTYSKGIVHNGSHMVDLIEMFVGPVEVHSVGPALRDHWDDDPTVDAILTTVGRGQPIHLVSGDSRAVTQFELVFNFEHGEIAIRDGGMRIETRETGDSATFAGYRQLGPVKSVAGRYPESMAAAYDNMAEVIAGKAYPKWGRRNGYSAHAICDEIRSRALENLKDDPES